MLWTAAELCYTQDDTELHDQQERCDNEFYSDAIYICQVCCCSVLYSGCNMCVTHRMCMRAQVTRMLGICRRLWVKHPRLTGQMQSQAQQHRSSWLCRVSGRNAKTQPCWHLWPCSKSDIKRWLTP